ncbi:MAG: hypothetical protein ACFCD0_28705 [Gemmataceae bacterium]
MGFGCGCGFGTEYSLFVLLWPKAKFSIAWGQRPRNLNVQGMRRIFLHLGSAKMLSREAEVDFQHLFHVTQTLRPVNVRVGCSSESPNS